MKFIEGEDVLVWHSSTKDYSKGKVLSVRGEKYKIQLKNGIELMAPETDIRSERPSRVAARMSTRASTKSPVRSTGRKRGGGESPSRSYGRSPGRPTGRSPGRPTGRSPARASGRSPARASGRSPVRASGRSPVRAGGRSPARSPARAGRPRGRHAAKTSSSAGRTTHTSPVGRKPILNTRLAKVSLLRIDVSTALSNFAERFLEEKKASMLMKPVVDLSIDTQPLKLRIKETGMTPRRTTRSSASVSRPQVEHTSVLLPRSIDRAVSLPAERKNLLHDFPPEGKERGLSVQRDHDLMKTAGIEKDAHLEAPTGEKWKKEIYMVNQPQEWGGWIGTLILLFVLPACLILPQMICTKAQCKFAIMNSTMSTDVSDYITIDAVLAYTGFLTVLSVVSVFPIGKNVEGQYTKTGILKYRINGFLCAFVCLMIYGLCEYKGIAVTNFILRNFVQLSISGWLLGTILALLLHIKGIKGPVANLNIHASTNSAIYNFWQGKEINPRVGRLDIKLILIRASVIGTLIIHTAILTKALSTLGTTNLKLAVYIITPLQLFCALDFLVFESTILTSFKIMYEGTGYMTCIGHLLYPFLATLTARFALQQKTPITYVSGIFILFFLIGYTLYRRSNSQKNSFRRNPLTPGLAYLKTIPTSRGKRLIGHGLWGYVKHPNYLGDILMQWSISLIPLAGDIMPYYAAICCTLVLLHRAVRDDERCKTRYGSAWDLYSARVKYRILRRVF